ncbi:MAG: hypothetical protein WCI74_17770 [Actinomycetes bacterium]
MSVRAVAAHAIFNITVAARRTPGYVSPLTVVVHLGRLRLELASVEADPAVDRLTVVDGGRDGLG